MLSTRCACQVSGSTATVDASFRGSDALAAALWSWAAQTQALWCVRRPFACAGLSPCWWLCRVALVVAAHRAFGACRRAPSPRARSCRGSLHSADSKSSRAKLVRVWLCRELQRVVVCLGSGRAHCCLSVSSSSRPLLSYIFCALAQSFASVRHPTPIAPGRVDRLCAQRDEQVFSARSWCSTSADVSSTATAV